MVFFSMSPLNYRSKMRVFMINYTCMIYMYLFFFSFLILCVYTLYNSYQEVKIQIKINGLVKPTFVHVLLQEPTLLFKFMITEFVSSLTIPTARVCDTSLSINTLSKMWKINFIFYFIVYIFISIKNPPTVILKNCWKIM